MDNFNDNDLFLLGRKIARKRCLTIYGIISAILLIGIIICLIYIVDFILKQSINLDEAIVESIQFLLSFMFLCIFLGIQVIFSIILFIIYKTLDYKKIATNYRLK